MKNVTVRDLRYHFSDIEARLSKGEEILVHKRNEPIARIVPVERTPAPYPDFEALRARTFRGKKGRRTGTEVVSEARGSY